MSEHSLQIIQVLLDRLNATAKRRSVIEMTFGIVLFVGVVAAVWLVATAIEAGLWLDRPARQIAFWLVLAVSLALAGWYVIRPLLKFAGVLPGPSQYSMAKDVGQAYPQISDKITNLLHLAEGKRSDAPNTLVDHAVRTLNQDVEHVEFEKMGDFKKAQYATRFASIPILGLLIFLIAAPGSFLGASARLLSPTTNFERPAPFSINVTPGSVELIRGDSLTIQVSLQGTALPQRLTLETQNEDEDKVILEELLVDENGLFSRTFVNVRRSFDYKLTAGIVESQTFSVEIVERPIIRSIQVALQFPGYSRIPAQRLEPNVGDVQALAGTQVSLDVAMGGRDIVEGMLVQSNGAVDTLAITGGQALGAFTLKEEGHYQIIRPHWFPFLGIEILMILPILFGMTTSPFGLIP